VRRLAARSCTAGTSAADISSPQLVLGFGNVGERAVESGIASVADLIS